MPGLDNELVDTLDRDKAFARVLVDVETDFIFAPQYKILYQHMKEEMWQEVTDLLRSGAYRPSPLISSEIPKPGGFSRPGSILFPTDRVLFQAISDRIAPLLDSQLDNQRVKSYRLLEQDVQGRMFERRSVSYQKFKNAIGEGASQSAFAIQADISSYFFHINHHILENLLSEADVPEGLVRLLVNGMLKAWSGQFSYSIPQGMFPSDLLGNYYLSALDLHLESKGIPSVRYVDDMVIFYEDKKSAESDVPELCRFLRTIGLDLNESKSKVAPSGEAVLAETELDLQFERARDEVYREILDSMDVSPYGFLDSWELPDDDAEALELAESEALKQLWSGRSAAELEVRDKLDRFCLGAFVQLRSRVGVGTVISEIGSRPHMTRIHCAYLAQFARENPSIRDALCKLLATRASFDSELQWPIAALLPTDSVPQSSVAVALSILQDRARSDELRALSAIFIGKFGSGPSRTVLRSHWDRENSEHVKAAMVYSAMFFNQGERNFLLKHWGSQSTLNNLIAKAVRKNLQTNSAATA